MNILSKFFTFLKEIKIEIKKVNWPDKQEVFRYTLIVIGGSIVVAAFLWIIDLGFTTILNRFVL